MKKIIAIAAIAATLLVSGLSLAGATNIRPDDVILTVKMPAEPDGAQHVHEFTLDDLKNCPQAEFTTSTIWTSGLQEFSGLWMHTLLQYLNVDDGHVELVAINDYRISVPVSEFKNKGALLAYARNGSPMTARENGPLWIVYNYDSDPRLRSESIYARSVWQLDRIIVSR